MISKKYAAILATGASLLAIGISAPASAANFGGTLDSHAPASTTTMQPAVTASITIVAGSADTGGASAILTGASAAPTAYATVSGGAVATAPGGLNGAFVQTAYNVNTQTALYVGPLYGKINSSINVAAADPTHSLAAGAIGVSARAAATATGTSAVFAHAAIRTGVLQHGAPVNAWTGAINNSGSINVSATATAIASNAAGPFATRPGAQAQAFIDKGINQYGGGTSNSVSLTNSGKIYIQSYAVASAANVALQAAGATTGNFASQFTTAGATATAYINNGISQFASGVSPTASLTNTGTIDIVAGGVGAGGVIIPASAYMAGGSAYAFADANLTANAYAQVGAVVNVSVGRGIVQAGGVSSGPISLTLANTGGVINIAASGQAQAHSGYASAFAGGFTTVSGTSVFASHARATALAGATVHAGVGTGIAQQGSGVGGSASLTNSGTININAVGSAAAHHITANAVASGTQYAAADAFAGARSQALLLGAGISQTIVGGPSAGGILTTTQPLSAVAPNVVVSLANSAPGASINIGVRAYAGAHNADAVASALATASSVLATQRAGAIATAGAYASAAIQHGIDQTARGGTPTASLTNSGYIGIRALATASGYANIAYATGAATLRTGPGTGTAYAFAGEVAHAKVTNGINQLAAGVYQQQTSASATGVRASAILTNTYAAGAGKGIFVGATAYANANPNAATPYAHNGSAYAYGTGPLAAAHASAGGFATAYVGSGISQQASGPQALAKLTNTGTIQISAAAIALSTSAYANALAKGVTNARALGVAGASAHASVATGIVQVATALVGGTSASVVLNNSGANGLINVGALAQATSNSAKAQATAHSGAAVNSASAYAGAYVAADVADGIVQSARGVNASAALTNSGTISISSIGKAVAHGGYAFASDYGAAQGGAVAEAGAGAGAAIGTGIYQSANGLGSSATLTNSTGGIINIDASAYAHADSPQASVKGNGGGFAFAGASGYATIGTGVYQSAEAVSLANSGTISIAAKAVALENGAGKATATGGATAFVGATGYAAIGVGIYQSANAIAPTQAVLTNSGTLAIGATAKATGANAAATADVGTGVYQFVDVTGAGNKATASLTNSGTIDIGANALANGTHHNATANAYIGAGILQQATAAGTAYVSFANSNIVRVHATAVANASGVGTASASALGVRQEVTGAVGQEKFTNTGTFSVSAKAVTSATSSAAFAGAYGLYASASGPLNLGISNTKTFAVMATATGSTAKAHAVGMNLSAQTLTGSLTNSGTISVSAAIDKPVAPAHVAPAFASGATATGLHFAASVNDAVVNNSGTIDVSAQTNGQPAKATAILLTTSPSAVTPGVGDVFTLNNNGGTIIARQSTTGGATWTHGTAIDLTNAPNAAQINLIGQSAGVATNGYIYGNILLSASPTAQDTITVGPGETKLDGVINPGVTPTANSGTLQIATGGTLYLANQPYALSGAPTPNPYYSGPAGANVGTFSVAAGGTLALQLPLVASGATYPVITANSVSLNGTLLIRPSSVSGLFGNTTVDPNIIVSNTPISGSFANVAIAGPQLALLTLGTNATNGATHVDLVISRVKFNAVAGLTPNQTTVGTGLENGYSTAATGGAALLYSTLFTEDAAHYQSALNQLSGEQYAGYLQSLNGLAANYNSVISSVTDCPDFKASIDPTCQRVGKSRIWVQTSAGHTRQDDDAYYGLGGYGSNQFYLAGGFDYQISPPVILGLSAGYVRNDVNFNTFGGQIKSDGYQVAAYGMFDAGRSYAKAIVSYSGLTGHSSRSINIVNQAPQPGGANITGLVSSTPKADVLSVYGEVGYRLGYESIGVTPYVSLEYTDAKLKAFNETGLAPADLSVADSTYDRTAAQLGLRFGGAIGRVTPEVNVGWRHQFGSRFATVNSSFTDIAGSAFTVQSPYQKADSVFVDFALSAALSKNVVGKLGYQGRITTNNTSNAGMATLIVSFGN